MKPAADSAITRTDAVRRLQEATGDTKGAVQQRIQRALKAGTLTRRSRNPNTFTAGKLGAWAAQQWPACAEAIAAVLPMWTTIVPKSAHQVVRGHSPRVIACPGDLAGAQAKIAEQDARIAELEQQVAAERAEKKRLQAADERRREINTKRGRRTDF